MIGRSSTNPWPNGSNPIRSSSYPLNSEELTWAVREPARRVGVGMEQGLAEDIVSEVLDQPGALPLVQYTMTELFERRQDNLLIRPAYEEIGGVLGALGGRAEEIYAKLGRQDKEQARQLYLRLVTLGEGVEDTRRRVLRSELEALASKNGTQIGDDNGLGVAHHESSAASGVQGHVCYYRRLWSRPAAYFRP